jgi:hypothetical protein
MAGSCFLCFALLTSRPQGSHNRSSFYWSVLCNSDFFYHKNRDEALTPINLCNPVIENYGCALTPSQCVGLCTDEWWSKSKVAIVHTLWVCFVKIVILMRFHRTCIYLLRFYRGWLWKGSGFCWLAVAWREGFVFTAAFSRRYRMFVTNPLPRKVNYSLMSFFELFEA